MTLHTWTLEIASRRNIRSVRDLWLYVARMTVYIGFLTAIVTGVQARDHDWLTIVVTMVASLIVTSVLAIPITWEFGRMYLDLWRATQTLHGLARSDLQTGLLNNRTFVTEVEARLAAGRPVALLLADLDRFKSINDRHGHPKGDEVIAAVGDVVRDLFGETAILGRLGGEEFAAAIECPFGDADAGTALCERWADELRLRVAAIRIEATAGRICPTVSVGIARSNRQDGFSGLYARADKALYVAKAAGRNRVVDETHVEAVGGDRRRETKAAERPQPSEDLLAAARI